jgi:uncharacterized protein (TIGR00730 family)
MREYMTERVIKSICVYCGSSDQIHPNFNQGARELGQELARRDIRLIYGGGKTGLMGAVAGGVLSAGGKVTGIVPESLNQKQLIADNLTELEVLGDIQSRKKRMLDLADALIALPGGFGTFDELFEALTWAQIGLHSKPIGLLNIDGYFDMLLMLIEHASVEGFIYPEHKDLLIHTNNPGDLIDRLSVYTQPEKLHRWVTREKED